MPSRREREKQSIVNHARLLQYLSCIVAVCLWIAVLAGCNRGRAVTPITQLPPLPGVSTTLTIENPDPGQFVLTERIENQTDREILVYASFHGQSRRFVITDSDGDEVPLSEYGEKRWEARESRSPSASHLKPGQVTDGQLSLSHLFDFPGPGTYTVELSTRLRFEGQKPGELKYFRTDPEPVTFTVDDIPGWLDL